MKCEEVNAILQSKAYARYVDKTQVVYLIDNDHITKRGLHVQMVSRLSREVGHALGLNLDLIEAIALGHDVGHPPFGHEGEGYLSELSIEFGNGSFAHPFQSCRLFSSIEPLPLSLEVFDGFLCHDGGLKDPIYQPQQKTAADHQRELEEKKHNPHGNLWPMTIEGCVVKICDTISYVARDIEDAITLGILNREEIPSTSLGIKGRDIVANLRQVIIEASRGKPYLEVPEKEFEALKLLRRFNFERIYHYPNLKVESEKIKKAYRLLFEALLFGYRKDNVESPLYRDFLHNKPSPYLNSSSDVEKTVDYIAGMTNSFFLRQVNRFLIPAKISWDF
jgi:dGTPase